MTKFAAIEADFVTFRHIQGRKQLQLIFEVPQENANAALETLGMPKPGENKWCAIALLNFKPEAEGQAPEGGGSPKSSKPFSTLPLSQQAAIRCGDPQFLKFLMCGSEAEAIGVVRENCGVESRSLLVVGSKAGDAWLDLESRYQSWLTDQKYAGVHR